MPRQKSTRPLAGRRQSGVDSGRIRRACRFVLEAMEGRVLMSVASVVSGLGDLDLASATGNSGTINGAVFTGATGHNTSGSGVIDSFVRLDNTGVEQGYNTAARPYSDSIITNDAGTTATFNHPIQLKDLPVVVRQQGSVLVPYFEFVLDLNQENSLPYISLDALQVSTASSGSLTGYTADGTYGNVATVAYDMHGGTNAYNAVALDSAYNTGSGSYDMFLNIPVSDFSITTAADLNKYVYVYSQFGKQTLNDAIQPGTTDAKNGGSANDGYEEWARGVGQPIEANGLTATAIREVTPTATGNVTSVPAGATVQDTSTVMSSNSSDGTPTGTVQYNFYSTSTPIYNVTAPVWTNTQTLSGGIVPNSQITAQLAPGSYSFIAVYSGGITTTGFDLLGRVSAVEPLTVTQPVFASPTISTLDGGPVTLGSGAALTDVADLEGGNNPTGTITFNLYAPSDTSFTSPIYTDVVTVNGNGKYGTSIGDNPGGYVPSGIGTLTGTYEWLATYSGDSGNLGVISTAGSEPEDVKPASSTAATVIKDAATNGVPTGTLGEAVYDTATVTGTPASTPTGTLTYEFFTTIDGSGTHTDATVALDSSGGVPDSAATAALAAGSYSYVAVYSGDTNYAGFAAPVEPLTIAQGTPSISTTIHNAAGGAAVTAALPLGSAVYDTVAFGGTVAGFTPGGTVTYNFYTSASPVYGADVPFTTIDEPAGTNSPTTGSLGVGSYAYIAVYNGDSNYKSVVGSVEPLTIAQQTPMVSTTIHNAAGGAPVTTALPLGSAVYDTVALGGTVAGFTPGGTVTYNFYTSASPVYGADVPVASIDEPVGTNSPTTGALGAGGYAYIAVYNGDSNYASVVGSVEPLTISQGKPTVSTTIHNAAGGAAATAALPLGSAVYDTVALGGTVAGFTPGGTVTYNFYTSANPVYGTDVPVASVDEPAGTNSPTSGALGAGSYAYIAVYNGDSNYKSVVGSVEPLTISKGTITVTTTLHNAANGSVININSTVPGGTSIYDTVSFSGATAGFTPDVAKVTYTFSSNGVSAAAGSGAQSTTQGPLGGGHFVFQAGFAGDSNYNIAVSAPEPVSTITAEAGLTLGYYSNKNGQNDLTGSTTGKTLRDAIYNKLFAAPTLANPAGGLLYNSNTGTSVLVDAKGHFEPLSFFKTYANVRTYLLNATATNMAYMLSAQLLTTEFNVCLGRVNALGSIFVPMVTIPGSSTPIPLTLQSSLASHGVSSMGVAVINDILTATVGALKAAPYTVASGASRTFEEGLKDLLDAINNNENIFVM
jgi:hypothetical protein